MALINKILAAAAFIILLAAAEQGGYRYVSLAGANFYAYHTLAPDIINLLLVLFLWLAAYGVGNLLNTRFNLCVPPAFATATGLLTINILLLPFFFLNLINPWIVGALLLSGIALLPRKTAETWTTGLRKTAAEKWLLFLGVPLAAAYMAKAMLPVSLTESLGDIANHYLQLPLAFAQNHGAAFKIELTPFVTKHCLYEVMTSALIILSNPGVVKLFGLSLFLMTGLLLLQLSQRLAGWKLAVFALCLFLTHTFFTNDTLFSFAHDRVYHIFAAFLAFALTLLGIVEQNPRYHYLALPVMGALSAISVAGFISSALNCGLILAFSKLWKERWKCYLIAASSGLLLTCIFPLWNFFKTGSPIPTLGLQSGAMGIFQNNVFNGYLSERNEFLHPSLADFSIWKVLAFPFQFSFESFGLLGLVIFFSLAYFRDTAHAVCLLYTFGIIYAYLFQAIKGGSCYRFILELVPILSLLLSLTLMRLAQIPILNAARTRFAVFTAHQFTSPGSRRRCLFALALTYMLALFLNSTVVLSWSDQALKALSGRTLTALFPASTQFHYLAGTSTLGEFLGTEASAKYDFLNRTLTTEDKIIYFFKAQSIYAKPIFYQPTITESASIVCRTKDANVILSALNKLGVGYLVFDAVYPLSPDNAGMPLIADATSPIFEPLFFARHFVPMPHAPANFYLFKINYSGLRQADILAANEKIITESGFYDRIYWPLKAYNPVMLKLRSNPYSPDELLRAYESFRMQNVLQSHIPAPL